MGNKLIRMQGFSKLNYEQLGALQAAYVKWLGEYIWDYWITLNFCPELAMNLSPESALKYIERFIRGYLMDRNPPLTISYVIVIEAFRLGGIHAHLFVAGCWQAVNYKQMGTYWRSCNKMTKGKMVAGGKVIVDKLSDSDGYCKIEQYDYSKGAGAYLVKYVISAVCDWNYHFNDVHRWDNKKAYDRLSESEKARVSYLSTVKEACEARRVNIY